MAEGELDLSQLSDLTDVEVIRRLSSLRGVGEWTAEMLLIFSLERPDVVSRGDLAIRRGMMTLYGRKTLDNETFKVLRVHVLEESVEVCALDDPGRVIVWQASEWSRCEPLRGGGRPPAQEQPPEKKPEKRQGNRREKRKA